MIRRADTNKPTLQNMPIIIGRYTAVIYRYIRKNSINKVLLINQNCEFMSNIQMEPQEI